MKDEEKILREFLTTRKKMDVVQIIREAGSLDHALKLMNGLAANGHLTLWDNATHPDGSSYRDKGMIRQDIEKLAVECGFEKHPINGYLVVRHSNGSWVNVKPKLEAFAKALLGDGEPSYWKVTPPDDETYLDGVESIKVAESMKAKGWKITPLYTKNQNTQAKLDKAVKALAYVSKELSEYGYIHDSKYGIDMVLREALIAMKGEQ